MKILQKLKTPKGKKLLLVFLVIIAIMYGGIFMSLNHPPDEFCEQFNDDPLYDRVENCIENGCTWYGFGLEGECKSCTDNGDRINDIALDFGASEDNCCSGCGDQYEWEHEWKRYILCRACGDEDEDEDDFPSYGECQDYSGDKDDARICLAKDCVPIWEYLGVWDCIPCVEKGNVIPKQSVSLGAKIKNCCSGYGTKEGDIILCKEKPQSEKECEMSEMKSTIADLVKQVFPNLGCNTAFMIGIGAIFGLFMLLLTII